MTNSLTIAGAVLLPVSVILFGLTLKSKSKSKTAIVFAVLMLGIFAGSIVMLVYGLTPSGGSSPSPPPPPTGGSVGPAFNTIPGPITITDVTAVSSTPGVLISFSPGGDCQMCQAVFDLTMTYSDKTTDTNEVTTGITSGAVYADYSPKMRPLPPGPVQISITGFSINPNVSGSQGPISAPYTLTTS